ncbi:MAG: pantoate--beta-alanine ligase [Candidatus Schekmanbacteria bacterium]|nr:pantoate--beta-alanine ligase [Candidatus Schekmanbacteria bacterium]
MKIIHSPQILQQELKAQHKTGAIIGFVPTMGALHEGHLSLIRRARRDCSLVVVSIFVNPTQFGPNEDYNAYPRTLEKDSLSSQQAGADIIFAPASAAMYPEGYQTYIEIRELTKGLCGATRPGHFTGVATVVCKLFNIVCPDFAYFGQKDYQQCQVIKRMAADLNFDLQIIVMPTVREADGLAMSSRNAYLSPEERKAATILYCALQKGQKMIQDGVQETALIRETLQNFTQLEKLAQIDYLEILHTETLAPISRIQLGHTLIVLAVKIGRTRLIDNCVV